MPWRTQWNLSAAYDLKLTGTHKLTFRADIFNVLNLLNYKWGGYTQITNTNLYNVNGFDQATQSFIYSCQHKCRCAAESSCLLHRTVWRAVFVLIYLNSRRDG